MPCDVLPHHRTTEAGGAVYNGTTAHCAVFTWYHVLAVDTPAANATFQAHVCDNSEVLLVYHDTAMTAGESHRHGGRAVIGWHDSYNASSLVLVHNQTSTWAEETVRVLAETDFHLDIAVQAGVPCSGGCDVAVAVPTATGRVWPANEALANLVALQYTAPAPIITSSVPHAGTTSQLLLDFTVTFAESVTGVTAQDLRVDAAGLPVAVTVDTEASATSVVWEFSVVLQRDGPGGQVSVYVPYFAGSIAPKCGRSDVYLVNFAPTPTVLSGSVDASTIIFTASFAFPVTGVAASDFNLEASDVVVTSAIVSGADREWTLTVQCLPTLDTTLVQVSIHVASGAVRPPNLASATSFQLPFSSPVPTISLSPEQAATTSSNLLSFEVAFTESVVGLSAADFSVNAGAFALTDTFLEGNSQKFKLLVSVDPSCALCPLQYVPSGEPGRLYCGRVVGPANWSAADALCAPYHLTSIHSPEQNEFVRSLHSPDGAW